MTGHVGDFPPPLPSDWDWNRGRRVGDDVAYLRLRKGSVVTSVAYDIVTVDLDSENHVIGVELPTLRPK